MVRRDCSPGLSREQHGRDGKIARSGDVTPMLHPVAWMRGPMVADAITDEERGRDDNYAGFQIDAVRGRA